MNVHIDRFEIWLSISWVKAIRIITTLSLIHWVWVFFIQLSPRLGSSRKCIILCCCRPHSTNWLCHCNGEFSHPEFRVYWNRFPVLSLIWTKFRLIVLKLRRGCAISDVSFPRVNAECDSKYSVRPRENETLLRTLTLAQTQWDHKQLN